MKTKINAYIDNIEYHANGLEDIIVVEKRLNNPKRDFLFVNKHQGKHIPTSPTKVYDLVEKLSKLIKAKHQGIEDSETIVVGFCETATCLGELIANSLGNKVVYLQTTREKLTSKKLFNFDEEHSHAVEQAIHISKELEQDNLLLRAKNVIFVDDEISTGNTIINFVNKFKQLTPNAMYIVASVCNWQSKQNKQRFRDNNIESVALITGECRNDTVKIEAQSVDLKSSLQEQTKPQIVNLQTRNIHDYQRNGHRANDGVAIQESNKIIEFILNNIGETRVAQIDIVGTEEFMFIPYLVANELEKKGFSVTFHATTRSPIDVTKESLDENGNNIENGIVHRYEIASPYDKNRLTYIYNLYKANKVYVITDARLDNLEDFGESYAKASQSVGNGAPTIIKI